MSEDNPTFKVVFVGDTTVGKTSIINKFVNLEQVTTSTLGATSTHVHHVYQDFEMEMNVWDTAGQESFRNLVPVYAKGAQAVVIVFDQAKASSYEHLSNWYDYLKQNVSNFRCVVAANKEDLEPVIDMNDAYGWAESHSAEFVRVSARDGTNISMLFDVIAKQLYELYTAQKEAADCGGDTTGAEAEDTTAVSAPTNTVDINREEEKKGKKGCC